MTMVITFVSAPGVPAGSSISEFSPSVFVSVVTGVSVVSLFSGTVVSSSCAAGSSCFTLGSGAAVSSCFTSGSCAVVFSCVLSVFCVTGSSCFSSDCKPSCLTSGVCSWGSAFGSVFTGTSVGVSTTCAGFTASGSCAMITDETNSVINTTKMRIKDFFIVFLPFSETFFYQLPAVPPSKRYTRKTLLTTGTMSDNTIWI